MSAFTFVYGHSNVILFRIGVSSVLSRVLRRVLRARDRINKSKREKIINFPMPYKFRC